MTDILAGYFQDRPVAGLLLGLALVVFGVVGVRLSVVDFRSHLLPNRIVFPAYPLTGVLLGSAALLASDAGRTLTMVGGAAVLWLAYFLLRVVYPAGMGFGDVKLAGWLGLYLGFVGWGQLLWGTFAAFGLGALWGLVLILSRRGTLKSAIPFGPFMIAGAALVLAVPSLG
ncbi:A24 family peptidase [Arthrobacter sp. Bz4]|uniref:prepilin peptidase n=1 Tax=Arthrobacter sp. Bz4 TaxID=2171979 RepID=UPI000D5229DF|nr:A24 family peptidase [Arthrobacter sp. Bz4]PVE16679.1 prepilin peptidase [Arthrobacter sp. Bz4]